MTTKIAVSLPDELVAAARQSVAEAASGAFDGSEPDWQAR